MSRPSPRRTLTLDLLRQKTRAALAALAGASDDALCITYVAPSGEEIEISRAHFLDDMKCAPGVYRVELGDFRAEGTLIDPTATPSGGADLPNAAMAKLVAQLCTTAENSVENAARREREAYELRANTEQRCAQLEATVSQLLARNAALESGHASDASLKELQSVLLLLVQQWIGGGAWTTERVKQVVRLVAVVQGSSRVQDLLREEGATDVVRALCQ